MKIIRIELENIKKYSNAKIELSDGVNFISGKNGAGKTTIIESIGFALFDYKVTKQNFAQYFIKKGEKKGQVRITFLDKNNNEYIADRKISHSGAGNSWTIKKLEEEDEIAVVSKDEDVRAWLGEHFEFYEDDNISDIYSNIISVPQGEFTVAFLESESERKKIFDPIFNLESYKKAYDNIKLESGVTNEIRELENDINIKLGEIKKLSESEEEYKSIKALLDDEKKRYKYKAKEFQEIKQQYEKIEKQKSDFERINNDIKLLNVQLEKTEEYLKQKTFEIKCSKKALEITKDNEASYSEYVKTESVKKGLDAKYKEYLVLKENISQIEKRIELGTTQIEEKDKFIQKQREELHKKKEQLIIQNNDIEKLKLACQNNDEFNKDEKNIEIFKNNLNFLSENIIKLKQFKKDILSLLKAIENPKREIKILEDIKELTKKIQKDEACNDNILNNITIITNKVNELINAKSAENKESDEQLKNITIEIEKLKNDIIIKATPLIGEQEVFDEDEILRRCKNKLEDINKKFLSENLDIEKKKVEIEQRYMQLAKEKEEYLSKQVHIKEEEEEKNKWLIALEKLKNDMCKLEAKNIAYKDLEKNIEDSNLKLEANKQGYELYITNKQEAEKYDKLLREYQTICDEKKQQEEGLMRISTQLEEIKKSFDNANYTKVKVMYDECNAELIKLSEKLKGIEEQKVKLEKDIEYMKETKAKVKESEAYIKKLKSVNAIIKKLRNIIKNAPEHIAEVLIKNISSKASEIYTSIALDNSKLVWEKSYELVLYDILGGNEIRKEFRQLSGGEQITAALSVRLAMLELLTKLGIGILDEPTINMDSSRREHLADVIESVGKNFRQLIIVSHDDTFQSVTENNIVVGSE